MRRAARCLAAILAATLATAPLARTARAQEPTSGSKGAPPEAVAQARQHFTRGVKLYQEDDFRTALIEFNRAYEIAPTWQLLYNIGQSYYQLRDYANALRTMEKYVAQGGTSIPRDRQQQVSNEMEELRGRVAHVTFTTSTPGADVSVDDVAVGATPFSTPVMVSAGRHKISATKSGWVSSSKVVDIAGGDTLTIHVDLAEEHHEPATPATVAYHANYVPAFFVGGVGLAGIVVGSVFGAVTMGNKSTLNEECSTAKVCRPGTQSDIDAFNRDGVISTIGFGVGLVGLGVGAYLFFSERAKDGEEVPAPSAESARVTVHPWIGPGGAGLSGSF